MLLHGDRGSTQPSIYRTYQYTRAFGLSRVLEVHDPQVPVAVSQQTPRSFHFISVSPHGGAIQAGLSEDLSEVHSSDNLNIP